MPRKETPKRKEPEATPWLRQSGASVVRSGRAPV